MKRLLNLLVVPVFAAGLASAQMNGPVPKSFVNYAAEPASIAAKKPAVVELHFKVLDGYHMNSHTPKSELLIPTVLKLEPATGVKLGAIDYPVGHEYSFSFNPQEKLDVYTGDVTLKTHLTAAAAGTYTVKGVLSYQACDNAACYPPKKLPVEIEVTAK
ncbi:MAG: protein-disulfide reductase DsbD N-terminal domain-containing protein [Acidobacteria bacterium]|nr:protein-disulfide reductase DsbD N-terminal domain-containing protein [Acidobacteriota bacterium]